MRPQERNTVALHLMTGCVLVVAGYEIGVRPELGAYYWRLREPLFVSGLVVAVLAGLCRREKVARYSRRVCLVTLSMVLSLTLAELLFRFVGFDFRHQEAAWRRVPPYFRKPMTPLGNGLFRRAGPEKWTGPVIRTYLEQLHLAPGPYRDEPSATIYYDQNGFRNEQHLSDWEIAITGDSFTELGHLPFGQLFTTLLGQRLRLNVLNLGVSYTGPLTQLDYLRSYGLSPGTKHAVVVFFEGNDLEDATREYKALRRYQSTGLFHQPGFHVQTSFLRAIGDGLRSPPRDSEGPPPVDALFASRHGEVLVTLGFAPRGAEQITSDESQALDYFFQNYAEFGARHHLRVWIAYMPCKTRVLHGTVTFTTQASEDVRTWQPNDLPRAIGEWCARYAIQFIDLTPTLVDQTRKSGELLYNGVYDAHLNARGSAVVAEELARRFQMN